MRVGEKTFHGKIKTMSGTASANIFSGDPGKKFDVVFSLDMKELLTGLGAKPEQLRKVLATAEANRKKPLSVTSCQHDDGGRTSGGHDGESRRRRWPARRRSACAEVMPGGWRSRRAVHGARRTGAAMAAGAAMGGPGAAMGGRGRAADQALRWRTRRCGRRRRRSTRWIRRPGGGMMSQLSEEDGKKFREAMQKALAGKSMRDL